VLTINHLFHKIVNSFWYHRITFALTPIQRLLKQYPNNGGLHRIHTDQTTAEAGCYQYESDADGGYQVSRGSRQDSDMAYATLMKGVAQSVKNDRIIPALGQQGLVG
jgi:hypothetical protein